MIDRLVSFLRKSPLTYSMLVAIASAINFFTLIIFGRVFSVEDYGVVSTLQAAVTNLGVLVIPIQIIVCKSIAEDKKESRDVYNAISLFILVNILITLVMVFGSKILMQYLHFEKLVVYVLFAFLVITNNVFLLLNGVLQGKQLFIPLGTCTIIFYVVKLAIGWGLGIIGNGYQAVIVGMAFSELVCIWYLLSSIKGARRHWKNYEFGLDQEVLKSFAWTLLLYAVVSLYLNNGDLLLGNLYCSKTEMGLYSVAINLAKISYFLIASPIATMIMPKIAHNYENVRKQGKILLFAEVITFVLMLVYSIVFCLLGGTLIEVLYGKNYIESASYIAPCAGFSIVLGMFWIFYQYAVVTSLIKSFSIITAIVGGVYGIGVVLYKPNIGYIPIGMSIVMVLSVFLSIIYLRVKKDE
ncbi:polysaccharide biosynthesis protein [Butyrivibrio proteoclasticus B316]|uniref:Polysaccharide biosynthesis protein n=1 Tax=Butyrivibrio proteoclasticus (strain ATCC 51982 / DSM 14932 / B316) TaxID=515622 RepID=E0RZE5_BUTPB|nr:oligosaccharide flippase family protein [Butyrivibrio proteoclasticus]ADL33142.1 polysaccharide biosynthesis protein [Butyrivibrio proteoclasticus B316]